MKEYRLIFFTLIIAVFSFALIACDKNSNYEETPSIDYSVYEDYKILDYGYSIVYKTGGANVNSPGSLMFAILDEKGDFVYNWHYTSEDDVYFHSKNIFYIIGDCSHGSGTFHVPIKIYSQLNSDSFKLVFDGYVQGYQSGISSRTVSIAGKGSDIMVFCGFDGIMQAVTEKGSFKMTGINYTCDNLKFTPDYYCDGTNEYILTDEYLYVRNQDSNVFICAYSIAEQCNVKVAPKNVHFTDNGDIIARFIGLDGKEYTYTLNKDDFSNEKQLFFINGNGNWKSKNKISMDEHTNLDCSICINSNNEVTVSITENYLGFGGSSISSYDYESSDGSFKFDSDGGVGSKFSNINTTRYTGTVNAGDISITYNIDDTLTLTWLNNPKDYQDVNALINNGPITLLRVD